MRENNFLKKSFKKRLKFETPRLFIRTLIPQDVTDEYVSGLNDCEVNRYLEVRIHQQSSQSIRDFVVANLKASDSLLLGIFIKESNELIGTIRLSNISFYHRSLAIGICLFSKKDWGQGYAFEALVRIKEFIVSDMNMHYLEAGVYAENKASVKLFEKAGFELYAKVSDKYRLDNRFVDLFLYRSINPKFKL